MPPQLSDSEEDSGPEPDEEQLAEEISSTISRVSKGSHGLPTATVMVDETDDGEEMDVGFMSGRPGSLI